MFTFKKYKVLLIDILILFLLSTIPLLWFPKDYMVTGHDAGYPINILETYKSRFFTWNSQDNFGSENTVNLGAIPVHTIEAFAKIIGFSLYDSQKIAFIFWFFVMGLGMYVFALSLKETIAYRYFPLLASVLYIFNFYLLALWRYGAGTTFSAYTALPLVMLFYFKLLRRKASVLRSGLAIALVLFLFNGGGGFSIPLFGGLLLSIFSASIYFLLIEERKHRVNLFVKIVLTAIVILFFSFFLNAFWLLPFINYVTSNFSRDVIANGGSAGVIAWTDSVSKFTSITNLFRLQGFPDWYEDAGHGFAQWFLSNPLLIFLSWVFAPVAYGSLFIVKKKEEQKIIFFFITLSLIGILFSAGTHPPTGWIFIQFILHIPGFAVFRSAQYKFVPALYFAFAILISYVFSNFLNQAENWKFSKIYNKSITIPAFILIFLGILFYNFPYFQQNFFTYNKPLTTLLKVPDYIFKYDSWIKDNLKDTERILIMPRFNSWWRSGLYNWNYFSLDSLFNKLRPKPFVEYSHVLNPSQSSLVNRLAEEILVNGPLLSAISSLLQTTNILITNDANLKLDWIPVESPKVYENAISKNSLYRQVWSNWPWNIYSLPSNEVKKIFGLNTLTYFNGPPENIIGPVLSKSNNFFQSNNIDGRQTNFNIGNLPISNRIFSSECVTCSFDEEITVQYSGTSSVLPGSFLYLLKEWKERNLESNDLNEKELVLNKLGLSYKRTSEINSLVEMNRKEQVINVTLNKLFSYWTYLKKFFYKYNSNNIDIFIAKRIEKYAQDERTVLMRALETTKNDSVKSNILQIINILDTLQTEINNYRTYWLTIKKYNIPKDFTKGELYIDLFKIDKNNEGQLQLPTSVEFGNKKFILEPKVEAEKVSLGNFDLTGNSDLILHFPDSANLLSNIRFSRVSVLNKRMRCMIGDINNYKPQTNYKLSLLNNDLLPDDVSIYLKKNNASQGDLNKYTIIPDSTFVVEKNSNYSQFFNFHGTDGDTGVSIYLCSSESILEVSKNFLKVEKNVVPILYFQVNSDVSPNVDIIPIKSNRIDQTKYSIDLENNTFPLVLVFNENFNPKWQLYNTKNVLNNFIGNFTQTWFQRPILSQNHFIMYGYLNAWYIEKKPEGKLILEFSPQKMFYQGILLSIMSIILVIGLYFFYIKRNK